MTKSTRKREDGEDDMPSFAFSTSARFIVLTILATSSLALLSGIALGNRLFANQDEHGPTTVPINGATVWDESADDDETVYVPGSGLQLMVEIRGADRLFLSSEERLFDAMVNVAEKSSLRILSYHCNKARKESMMGMNCFGIMPESSHISFQTWFGRNDTVEKDDSITIDILLSGSHQFQQLDMMLPAVNDAFSIHGEGNEPNFRWTLKSRNYRYDSGYPRDAIRDDLGIDFLSSFYLKKAVATELSDFQQIDIWDIVDSTSTNRISHYRSLSGDGSYESLHPELFQPDRIVFLDGVLQSTGRGNGQYHEALVQPAMFAHDGPRRVAIIGGGEGATLKEVLKHRTLEKVKMIEIDEVMVTVSRNHLPSWNLCSDMVGSTISCFDDPRAEVYNEDALAWFINRFHDDPTKLGIEPEEKFDVIISDALDPQDTVEFANVLYQNDAYLKSLYNALSDNGVVVFQVGITNRIRDPPEYETSNKNREIVKLKIEHLGFQSVHMYDEIHCGFEMPWSFIIACKSTHCRSNWYANPAEVDREIHGRILPSISGSPLLEYFDGSTMARYHIPPKAVETVYCRKTPIPAECNLSKYFSSNLPIVMERSFHIHHSQNKFSITAGEDIPMGAHIHLGSTIKISEQSDKVFNRTLLFDKTNDLEPMVSFLEKYRIDPSLLGRNDYFSNSGIPLLSPLGIMLQKNGILERKDKIPLSSKSPVVARHLPHFESGHLMSLRDIKKGEEILL